MSLTALSTYVNALAEAGRAIVTEGASPAVTLDRLDELDAREIERLVVAAGISCHLFDASSQALTVDSIDDCVEPFRVVFMKPELENTVGFVSIEAFTRWCSKLTPVEQVLVGCSPKSGFVTEAFCVNSWECPGEPRASAPRKQPSKLVRDSSGSGLVPSDVRPYLLDGADKTDDTDPFFVSWKRVAAEQLVLCISSEVSANEVEFVGPPRLRFPLAERIQPSEIASSSFRMLQDITKWIYDSEREAELRHRLFAQELARIGYSQCSTLVEAVARHAAHALEGARIVYSFSVQELARDSLKSLAELRKAVVEETQKLVETTRQVALAAAGALFYGLGLFAARAISASVDSSVLLLMAVVGLLYVWAILLANWRQMSQQASLRLHWKTKLYRYLSEVEYRELVEKPTASAESFLRVEMWVVFFVATAVFGAAISFFR